MADRETLDGTSEADSLFADVRHIIWDTQSKSNESIDRRKDIDPQENGLEIASLVAESIAADHEAALLREKLIHELRSRIGTAATLSLFVRKAFDPTTGYPEPFGAPEEGGGQVGFSEFILDEVTPNPTGPPKIILVATDDPQGLRYITELGQDSVTQAERPYK